GRGGRGGGGGAGNPAGPAPRIRTSNRASSATRTLPRQKALDLDIAVLFFARRLLEDDEAQILPLLHHLNVERELHIGGVELVEIDAHPGHLRAAVLIGRNHRRRRERRWLVIEIDVFRPLRGPPPHEPDAHPPPRALAEIA